MQLSIQSRRLVQCTSTSAVIQMVAIRLRCLPTASQFLPRIATAMLASQCSISKTSRPVGCSQRWASSTKSCSSTTSKQSRQRSRRSTAGSTKTGAATTRTVSTRRRTSPWPIPSGPSRNSSGRSTVALAASSCAQLRQPLHRALGPSATQCSIHFGLGSTKPESPSLLTLATAVTHRTATRSMASVPRSAAATAHRSRHSTSSARPMTSSSP